MPTILQFAQGNFAANRLGVRGPSLSLMPGLQLWSFIRNSIAGSPNQIQGGPALSAIGGGPTFQPTYASFPGSTTTLIALETSVPDGPYATYMAVARTSAPARISCIASCTATGPGSGSAFSIYNVGNQMGVYSVGPQNSTAFQNITAGIVQNWGFYVMRVTNGVGITTFAKTDSNPRRYDISNTTARVVAPVTHRIGMDSIGGSNNAAIDIAFAAIIAGSTAGSAISDALIEQCYQSVKYSLSLDGIAI